MTVKDLIEKLKQFPEDYEVIRFIDEFRCVQGRYHYYKKAKKIEIGEYVPMVNEADFMKFILIKPEEHTKSKTGMFYYKPNGKFLLIE